MASATSSPAARVPRTMCATRKVESPRPTDCGDDAVVDGTADTPGDAREDAVDLHRLARLHDGRPPSEEHVRGSRGVLQVEDVCLDASGRGIAYRAHHSRNRARGLG